MKNPLMNWLRRHVRLLDRRWTTSPEERARYDAEVRRRLTSPEPVDRVDEPPIERPPKQRTRRPTRRKS